ncbi:MAG: hypothetical protein ABW022_05515 [Actinoplanes sp.]
MTTVLDASVAASPTPAAGGRAPRARIALSILPWLIPAVALVVALLDTGTPARDIGLYAVYFAYAVVLPGTLVHRAIRGSRGNLPEDLGLGAAVGLLVLLIGWALGAATGLQGWLRVWPLLIIALFVAVPSLRRHWRIADPRPLPLAWSWIIAGALLVLVGMSYPGWVVNPLPPAETVYYQDVLYHLALVHEMTRSMPFEVPQLAGDLLRYHYLSDADIAAASMISGVEIPTVMFRLWIVPVAAVTVFLTAGLTRELSGKWWAGALGGVAGVIGLPLHLGAGTEVFGNTAVSAYSPSQTYVYPMLGLLLLLAVDLLRGNPLRWGWTLVFPLALAAAGAKSSALPPLIAGLCLAGVVVLIRDRRRLPALAAFFGLVLAAMLAGLRIFAGGGAGTLGLQPFAVLWWFPPYRQTLGPTDINDGSQTLPIGVEQAGVTGMIFLGWIVIWWMLMQAPRLLGVLALGAKRTRREPAAWLLAGFALAGSGALWVFWHPSASQLYFFVTIVPFATALTVWYLADQAGNRWKPVVAGLLAGGIWAVLAPDVADPAKDTLRAWAWALGWPILRTLLIAAAAGLIGLVIWRLVAGRFVWRAVLIALIAGVLGASIGRQVDIQVRQTVDALTNPPPPLNQSRILLEAEAAGALWLEENSGRDDLVATNVHCWPITWTAACDSRAFWVAGLGGRRTLVESWGYTDQALALDGINGKRYALQPAPYPERFVLNQRTFAEANPADVAELRSRYGVKWLFADDRAVGGVSPRLRESATLRYENGPVTIYEIR